MNIAHEVDDELQSFQAFRLLCIWIAKYPHKLLNDLNDAVPFKAISVRCIFLLVKRNVDEMPRRSFGACGTYGVRPRGNPIKMLGAAVVGRQQVRYLALCGFRESGLR